MIGIDIISINRIEKSLKKFDSKIKNRFMTEKEQSIFKKTASIAGVWATKEAFSKAIGTGIGKDFNFLDIEILKNEKGKPYINIINKKLSEQLKNKKIDVSITHDGGFAISAVLII